MGITAMYTCVCLIFNADDEVVRAETLTTANAAQARAIAHRLLRETEAAGFQLWAGGTKVVSYFPHLEGHALAG